MPENTDSPAQRRRKKEAFQSAAAASFWLGICGAGLLILSRRFAAGTPVGAILTIASVLDLGMIIPVWILYKTRLKEIEGGEEDAAGQY